MLFAPDFFIVLMFEAYACSGFCGFLLPELRRRLLRRVRVFFSPGCGAMRSIISAVAPYEPIGAGSGAEALSSAAAGAVVDGDATGEFAGVAAGVTAGVAAGAVLACVCCTSFCSAFSFTASCLALSVFFHRFTSPATSKLGVYSPAKLRLKSQIEIPCRFHSLYGSPINENASSAIFFL